MTEPIDRTPSEWHIKEHHVAKGYESVAEAFRRNFEEGEEVGAALAAYVDGVKVIDMEGGYKSTDYEEPYAGALQLVYSTSKNLEALLVARAVQEGYIKYDDPIAKHWPEYTSAPNKENVLIKDLMGHRGGIAWLDEENQIPMDEMHDLDKIASYLARQPHNYDGETKQAYHASTRGLVANEVLRRVTGKDMGRLLQEWIAEPLGVEAYFGLPEHLEERVAKFADYPFKDRPRAKTDPEANAPAASGPGLAFPPGLAEKQATLMKTFGTFKTPPGVDLFDTRVGRAAQVPSANCVTNARSLAKIFATIANHGTLDGTTILSKETLDLASVSQETMDDAALPLPPVPFSTGGWAQWKGLKAPNRFDLKDDEAEWEGWFGYGGSTACFDRKNNVAFAWTMNARHFSATGDRRTKRLFEAFVDAYRAART